MEFSRIIEIKNLVFLLCVVTACKFAFVMLHLHEYTQPLANKALQPNFNYKKGLALLYRLSL